MNRRAFTTSALAFTLLPPLRAQSGSSPAASRADDVNAVYSLILTAECTCCAPKGKLLIDALTYQPDDPIVATRTYTPIERAMHAPGSLSPFVSPPAGRFEDAAELVAAFKEQNAHRVAVEDHLKLPHPYHLVTPEENLQYFILNPQGNVYDPSTEARARVEAVPAKVRREFSHTTGLISLSPVGFNASRSLALFSRRSVGNSCSTENWYVLEKTENGWATLSWPTGGTEVCA